MKKMYVLVNKDLKMSRGKACAQVAHAVTRLETYTPDVMVVLEATTEQLHNFNTYLDTVGLKHLLYIDEGANEVPPYSVTAMAVEPIDEQESDFGHWGEKSYVFSGFSLYKDDERKRRWHS